jgi:branched-chain amino acid transport system ATP-binding protein
VPDIDSPNRQDLTGVNHLVEARDLAAGYDAVPVMRGVSLYVNRGEIVVLLGPNGAGKTTTLLTLTGRLKPLGGAVLWKGQPTRAPLHRRAGQGLAFVTEERSVFMGMTVSENLRVGRGDVDVALELFPELKDRLGLRAGLLSGGEQQMLSLGRALSRKPSLLVADELSLGLAPKVIDRLLDAVKAAARTGVGVLLVEQHIHRALAIADRAYVMRRGEIEMSGPAAQIIQDMTSLQDAYFSGSPA